ncbi:MAG: beta-ketoacyl synthase chain length factor [Dongiaceae bacterium]
MMLHDLFISVDSWFAWAPGLESRTAWRAWAGGADLPAQGEAGSTEGLVALPMMLRRRIDSFSQKVIGAALACGDLQKARYVFASRHGEFSRTRRILGDLSDQQLPSPADFSMSVHHALAGLLSIHTGNKAGHTTIAAGTDSFGYGLLEAVTTLAEQPDQPVLLVCYDEPLPDEYQVFEQTESAALPIILALKLGRGQDATGSIKFSVAPATGDRSTAGLARDFLDFYLSGRADGGSTGKRLDWRWHRAA